MAEHMMSIDPLAIDDTFVGVRLLVTTPAEGTVIGGVSDVLRVEPDGWRGALERHPSTFARLGVAVDGLPAVAGCILWVGGRVLLLTSTSHVLAEATPTDGAS